MPIEQLLIFVIKYAVYRAKNLIVPYHRCIVAFHRCGVNHVIGVGNHHNQFCILYCVTVSLFKLQTNLIIQQSGLSHFFLTHIVCFGTHIFDCCVFWNPYPCLCILVRIFLFQSHQPFFNLYCAFRNAYFLLHISLIICFGTHIIFQIKILEWILYFFTENSSPKEIILCKNWMFNFCPASAETHKTCAANSASVLCSTPSTI